MIMGIQSFFLFFIFYKQLQLGSDKADGTFQYSRFYLSAQLYIFLGLKY